MFLLKRTELSLARKIIFCALGNTFLDLDILLYFIVF